MIIYNCCSLCLKEDKNNGDNLIWVDGMQLCKQCYNKYNKNEYEARSMKINAIRKYRYKLNEILEIIKYASDTADPDLIKIKELIEEV